MHKPKEYKKFVSDAFEKLQNILLIKLSPVKDHENCPTLPCDSNKLFTNLHVVCLCLAVQQNSLVIRLASKDVNINGEEVSLINPLFLIKLNKAYNCGLNQLCVRHFHEDLSSAINELSKKFNTIEELLQSRKGFDKLPSSDRSFVKNELFFLEQMNAEVRQKFLDNLTCEALVNSSGQSGEPKNKGKIVKAKAISPQEVEIKSISEKIDLKDDDLCLNNQTPKQRPVNDSAKRENDQGALDQDFQQALSRIVSGSPNKFLAKRENKSADISLEEPGFIVYRGTRLEYTVSSLFGSAVCFTNRHYTAIIFPK